MRLPWILLGMLAGVGLAAVLFGIDRTPEPEPIITCGTDQQCGGEVVTERFCQEGNVFARGQRNTCVNESRPNSAFCLTKYDPWLLETCANGCDAGACVEG